MGESELFGVDVQSRVDESQGLTLGWCGSCMLWLVLLWLDTKTPLTSVLELYAFNRS